MEDPGSIWLIGIIALLAGAMIGAMVYRLLSPSVKQSDHIKSELDAAQKELSDYKASVNQHFDKTSELVNDLTQNYVKVYQHLAEGAQNLGHNKAFNNLLDQRPGSVSIALDETERTAPGSADDRIVDAAAPAAAPEPAVDEHAEPFTGVAAAAADAVDSGDKSGESDATRTADADSPTTDTEAAPNLDALDEAAEKPDRETRADAAGVVAESEEKTEPRATIH